MASVRSSAGEIRVGVDVFVIDENYKGEKFGA